MTQWHGGKGSSRRPAQVPEETLRDNWDRIFGKSITCVDPPTPSNHPCPPHSVQEPTKHPNKP